MKVECRNRSALRGKCHSAFLFLPFLLPGRLIVGQRPLKARMLVRFQPRQPVSTEEGRMKEYEVLFGAPRHTSVSSFYILPSPFSSPGGEIESRLAYTQKPEGQNLPGRPPSRNSKHQTQSSKSPLAWCFETLELVWKLELAVWSFSRCLVA